MEDLRLKREESALYSKSIRPMERHYAFVRAPLERYGIRGEAPTRAVALEAALNPARTFFADTKPRSEVFVAEESEDKDHPENGKNFPLWKKIILVTGEGLAVVGTILFWLPIPLGLATLTVSLGLIGIAVGPRHAKRHVERVFHIVSTPVRWLLNTPPMKWLGRTIKKITLADRWMPVLQDRLKKLGAWIQSGFPKKKEEKKEPATS